MGGVVRHTFRLDSYGSGVNTTTGGQFSITYKQGTYKTLCLQSCTKSRDNPGNYIYSDAVSIGTNGIRLPDTFNQDYVYNISDSTYFTITTTWWFSKYYGQYGNYALTTGYYE